jgi:hypothetical protein
MVTLNNCLFDARYGSLLLFCVSSTVLLIDTYTCSSVPASWSPFSGFWPRFPPQDPYNQKGLIIIILLGLALFCIMAYGNDVWADVFVVNMSMLHRGGQNINGEQ